MIHSKRTILFHPIRKMILMDQNHIMKDKQENSMSNQRKSKSLLLNKINNQCFSKEDSTKSHNLLL